MGHVFHFSWVHIWNRTLTGDTVTLSLTFPQSLDYFPKQLPHFTAPPAVWDGSCFCVTSQHLLPWVWNGNSVTLICLSLTTNKHAKCHLVCWLAIYLYVLFGEMSIQIHCLLFRKTYFCVFGCAGSLSLGGLFSGCRDRGHPSLQSVGFCWSAGSVGVAHGLSCPAARGVFLDLGTDLLSPAWAGRLFPTEPSGKPHCSLFNRLSFYPWIAIIFKTMVL